MKKQITQKKMGFSLIELSIVILVIGLLVLGITKGSSIITKAKIGSAKSLTKGSPVALTDNLVAWYEPTLTTSFTQEEAFDGEDLTVNDGASWFDNSPTRANNATTVLGTVLPQYVESSTNSLPAVRFAASSTTDSSIAFNSLSLNQRGYTIFIVERRSAATGELLGLGGTGGNNTIEYGETDELGNASTGFANVTAFGSAVPRISTFLSDDTGLKVAINGAVDQTNDVEAAALLTATATGLIGDSDAGTANTGYTGDISEIIIFNRGLKTAERNDIQDYLSKKYSINVTVSAS
ncbi:MAG: type II secretory pathway pseudopilin PulG [Rickettsiales bacterium]|jgi:hypothetical protein